MKILRIYQKFWKKLSAINWINQAVIYNLNLLLNLTPLVG